MYTKMSSQSAGREEVPYNDQPTNTREILLFQVVWRAGGKMWTSWTTTKPRGKNRVVNIQNLLQLSEMDPYTMLY